jgi:hypothetical protein
LRLSARSELVPTLDSRKPKHSKSSRKDKHSGEQRKRDIDVSSDLGFM